MANAELLQRTLEHIKANPEQWEQQGWNACFAGWAVRLSMPTRMELITSSCDSGCCGVYEVLLDSTGSRIDVRTTAMEALGIDGGEGLFYSGNTLADLERIVSELTAKEAVSA